MLDDEKQWRDTAAILQERTSVSRGALSERALPFARHATTAGAVWALSSAWQGSLTERASGGRVVN
jgi:hypothetical protein